MRLSFSAEAQPSAWSEVADSGIGISNFTGLHVSRRLSRLALMQIVSGKYRHRKLESNPGETTRPITARVKVALFDRLQPELAKRLQELLDDPDG